MVEEVVSKKRAAKKRVITKKKGDKEEKTELFTIEEGKQPETTIIIKELPVQTEILKNHRKSVKETHS